MNPFDDIDKKIDIFLLVLFVLAVIVFLCACGSKTSMYHIYLEHQPNEPLYTTSSLKDAQEYYDYFKPFHSDMYITTIDKDNNLVVHE